MLPIYNCPVCDTEFKGTSERLREESFRCSCCASLLQLAVDGDYENGYWKDTTTVMVLEKGEKHEQQ